MSELCVRELGEGRLDVAIDNDATGFVMTAADLGGHARFALEAVGGTEWLQGLEAGAFLPIELSSDDCFIARVVVGDLTEHEQSESLARLSRPLAIPNGVLVISGGVEYLIEDADRPAPDSCLGIAVPAGNYRVTVHTLITSPNADLCLEGLGGDDAQPPAVGRWWRETRPDQEMPDWLASSLAEGLFSDHPDFDAEWEDWDGDFDPDDEPTVDFIIQLQALSGDPPMTPLERAERGWFLYGEKVQQPVCPMGLPVNGLWRPQPFDDGSPPAAVDVFERIDGKPVPLREPVLIDGSGLPLLARIAYWCNDSVDIGLRLDSEPGGLDQIPEAIAVARQEDGVTLSIANTGGRLQPIHDLDSMLSAISVPEGARFELATAAEAADIPGAGAFLFQGDRSHGGWRVTAALPALTAAELEDMCSLAAAAAGSQDLPCSPREAEQVVERSQRDPALEDMRVVFDRDVLRIKPRPYLELLAVHLFQVRYAQRLPICDEDALNRALQEHLAEIEQTAQSLFAFPVEPEPVLQGRSGRFMRPAFEQLAIDEAGLQQLDRSLELAGFQALGCVLSERFSDVLMSGFGDGANSYAVIMMNRVGSPVRECYTAFEDGTSLTTSTHPGEGDVKTGYYRQHVSGDDFEAVLASHRQAVAKRTGNGDLPRPAPATLAGLAAAIDEFLCRTLD